MQRPSSCSRNESVSRCVPPSHCAPSSSLAHDGLGSSLLASQVYFCYFKSSSRSPSRSFTIYLLSTVYSSTVYSSRLLVSSTLAHPVHRRLIVSSRVHRPTSSSFLSTPRHVHHRLLSSPSTIIAHQHVHRPSRRLRPPRRHFPSSSLPLVVTSPRRHFPSWSFPSPPST